MKQFLLIIVVCCCYCCSRCSSGKTTTSTETDKVNTPASAIPVCIQKMIDSAKTKAPGTTITQVRQYIYKGARVYLVAAPCCDQFNPLYDSACNLLFSPSGGITGKGDRKNPDFFTVAKEDSLIWEADR
jgi:hypothetical protein